MSKINLYQANSIITQDDDFSRGKILDGVKYGLIDYYKYIDKSIKLINEKGAIKIPLFKAKVVMYSIILNDKDYNKIESELFKENVKVYLKQSDEKSKIEVIGSNKYEKYLILNTTNQDVKHIYINSFKDKIPLKKYDGFVYSVAFKQIKENDAQKIEIELFEREVKTVYSYKPTGTYKEDRGNEISIIDRNSEEKYLIIEEDNVKHIYLKANDYQLRKQKEAIQTLRNRPFSEHTPLQKLFDLSYKAERFFEENIDTDYLKKDYWNRNFIKEIDWKILNKPEKYKGTDEQQEFVRKALATNDFSLLEGPPGSGKTTAIIELIIQLIKQNKRVLLVSATHVAVDNVIHRILTTYKDKCEGQVVPLRIAENEGTIRKESVKPYRLQTFVKNTKEKIRKNIATKPQTKSIQMLNESLKNRNEFDDIILKSANLVGGTMIGILQHPDIKKGGIQKMFDVMIVDEASKVTFLDFLVPALYAKKWILVGDVNQLSPYTEDDFINENIDAVISDKKDKSLKENLVKTFELKRKLKSDKKWDKESVKVFFSDDYNSVDLHKKEVFKIDKTFNPEQDVLKLNGADVIICNNSKAHKEILAKYLFVKAQFFEGKVKNPGLQHRQNAHHKNINIYNYEFSIDKNQKWKEMVGSRLSQMYQYRFEPKLHKEIKQELDFLVPNEFQDKIEKIRRVALPSILELLQIGVGDREMKDGKLDKKLIYQGFKDLEEVKRIKFQSLTYQHRMHDEIASIPREYFYTENNNLKTANTVKNREDKLSFYKPNENKVIWVTNSDKTFRKKQKGGKTKNINPTELNDIKNELEEFILRARNEKNEFEVAVLTFYREQEFELKKMLRRLTNQHHKHKFFSKNNVKITLCTVDKFQGDEADLVLLSFTKFTKKAFYNSPNRLNVALTRARYKLVLFGNKNWLVKNAQLEGLRKLAEKTKILIH